MHRQIEIVCLHTEHLELAVSLFDRYRQHYGQEPDEAACRRFLAERLVKGESVVYLAVEGDEALGFMQLYPSFSSLSLRAIWILNDLYVAEGARRKGVARLLLEQARQLALQTGAKSLILETAPDNHAARTLYEALGYVRDETYFHYALDVTADALAP